MKTLLLSALSCSLFFLQQSAPARPKVVTAAQVNGTWQSKSGTFRIRALGRQRLRVEFSGIYPYKLPDGTRGANTGEGGGIAAIEGRTAVFKPEGAEDGCRITMKFAGTRLEVTQEGVCGFGHNVTAAGRYRKVSAR